MVVFGNIGGSPPQKKLSAFVVHIWPQAFSLTPLFLPDATHSSSSQRHTPVSTQRGLALKEKPRPGFLCRTEVGSFSVMSAFTLGFLLLLQVEKDPLQESQDGAWFCCTVLMKTPEDDDVFFPCYKCWSRGDLVLLRGGRATKAFEDLYPRLQDQRKRELVQQKLTFEWDEYAEGMSYVLSVKNPNWLPAERRFSISKMEQFADREDKRTFKKEGDE
ncbi:hydroperoxide isomerase ALOXE3-like [Syngnathus scovelli]|uniref:hydroperoxide isomerase ALOXE3-like n=1 Tax=Syngnathus scovelli TaxID=161590 RepID=UPI0035CB93F6